MIVSISTNVRAPFGSDPASKANRFGVLHDAGVVTPIFRVELGTSERLFGFRRLCDPPSVVPADEIAGSCLFRRSDWWEWALPGRTQQDDGREPTDTVKIEPASGDRDTGAALRSVYQKTVDEAVPDEMLDLLGRLD
ncbi:MAG: NepR family anti-sigma factor [Janthinobacterium lividum]